MSNGKVRGRFVWHEVLTTDTKAAIAFYTKVVGWKAENWQHDSSYTLFTTAAGPTAGTMMLPEDAKAMGARPAWISYIGTPDVDATVRTAEGLGAKTLKAPTDIANAGRFAVLQDPQGAVFAVYKSAGAEGGDEAPALGGFSWHELATTNWQAAFDFYQKLFGWQKTESMDMGDMGTYQMYGWKGNTLGGMFNKPPAMPGPPMWIPYIMVKDSKAAAATATRAGGTIINGPMEVPGGDWIAQGMDPLGAMFAVHSKLSAPKPALKKPAAKRASAKQPKVKAKVKAAKQRAPKRRAAKQPAKKKAAKKKAARKSVKRGKAGKKSAARKKRR
jgi:predicted enzyme related to lactoylglutathione lyase